MPLENHAPAYVTNWGAAYCGDSLDLLSGLPDASINLVLTSPPFALQRQKEYGNKAQTEYVAWLAQFARLVHRKLKEDGSFVLDLGGAYEPGSPTRSLYNFRVAVHFCDELGFHLAEDFYWYNPSKLPSPIEWVNSASSVRRTQSTRSGGLARRGGPRLTCPKCSPNTVTA